MDGWSPAMYDEFGGSTNGDRRKYEEDNSTAKVMHNCTILCYCALVHIFFTF